MPNEHRDPLLRRIEAEYLEMPGLRLTSRQAQRLWGLDYDTCNAVLDVLVDSKFLIRGADEQYRRLTDGAPRSSPAPIAKADLPLPVRRAG